MLPMKKIAIQSRQLKRAIKMFEGGLPLTSIAERLGIRYHILRSRLGPQGRENAAQLRRLFTREQETMLVRRYENGELIAEMAVELAVSPSSLWRVLNRAGARIRKTYDGRFVGKDGYVFVKVPKGHPGALCNGYMLEHRLVMARKLGRPLERHETVHHINGDRTDNRPENLQLRQGRHGRGVVHRCRCCGSTDVELVKLAETH